MMKSQPQQLKKSRPCATNPARSKHLERWARAQAPANDPPFTLWHGLGLLGLLALFLAQQHAPGLLADLGTHVVADWDVGVYARLTALFLTGWAVFGVRAMHWAMYVIETGILVFLCLRIAEIRITHEPLTLGFALLMVIFSLLAIRIILRPNEYEQAQQKYLKEHSDV